MKQKRNDTRLESEGAEFLVLGNLLIQGIPSYKTYTNMPGYDLVATDPEKHSSVMIQVKSRFKTNWGGFIINNFDADFVVFVALNRGRSNKNYKEGISDPKFYIFPMDYVLKIRDPKNNWGKIVKSKMKDYEQFENRWDLIKEKLNK